MNMFGGVHPVEPESVVTRSDYQFIAIYRKALGPLVAKSTVSCGFSPQTNPATASAAKTSNN